MVTTYNLGATRRWRLLFPLSFSVCGAMEMTVRRTTTQRTKELLWKLIYTEK